VPIHADERLALITITGQNHAFSGLPFGLLRRKCHAHHSLFSSRLDPPAKVHPNHCGLRWMGLSRVPLLDLGSDQRRFKVKWEIHLYLIYTA